MTTSQTCTPTDPVLLVFQQDGGWHWGITIPRAMGSGFKLIAFSDRTFPIEEAARIDGQRVLARIGESGCGGLVVDSAPLPTGTTA